ncbi:DUF2782 domain-containing protein [Aerolutibacter ruishenii]|uniref:Uncharacterized protein DUF2782 n=1 Tax=Aerolutibacter ruishenii TaxID=686800 RepID=A0A562M099_9GAMM|nr:DUF2782 domain-containing protein [Lysobacter ruishenii]TWI13300.1 uncharacterized protein DUF2782 [Lysobacter ruishenii]
MRLLPIVLLAACLVGTSACASLDNSDPTAALEGATVTTRSGENGDVIEEHRVAGQLKVVKITPLRGAPYYLIDRDGDGHLDSSKGEGPVSPVYWKLFGW